MEIKLKPVSTKEKTKKLRGKNLNIYEKIDLIKRYKETVGEDIKGSTVFEGYPLGRFVLVLRSNILRGNYKYDSEIIASLKELGVLDYMLVNIDTRVNRLEEFCKNNNKLWKARLNIQSKYRQCKAENMTDKEIEEYIKVVLEDSGIKVDTSSSVMALLEELDIVVNDYNYIRTRKGQGKLKPNYEKRLKEAGVGSVFGYPEKLEEISDKADIDINVLDKIFREFGSLERFKELYIELLLNNSAWKRTFENIETPSEDTEYLISVFGDLDKYNVFKECYEYLAKNCKIITTFDISKPSLIASPTVSHLSYLLSGDYIGGAVVDENTLNVALLNIRPRYRTVLLHICKNKGEIILEDIAQMLQVSRQRISQCKSRGIVNLNNMQMRNIWFTSIDEEKKKEFIKRYFEKRDIFITPESYMIDDKTREELLETLGISEGIREEEIPDKSLKEIPNIPIEEVGFSKRASNSMFRRKYYTLNDLLNNVKSIGQLAALSGSGEKTIREIIDKVHSLGYTFYFENNEGFEEQEDVSINKDEELKDVIRDLKAAYRRLDKLLDRCERLKEYLKIKTELTMERLNETESRLSELNKEMSTSEIDEI